MSRHWQAEFRFRVRVGRRAITDEVTKSMTSARHLGDVGYNEEIYVCVCEMCLQNDWCYPTR